MTSFNIVSVTIKITSKNISFKLVAFKEDIQTSLTSSEGRSNERESQIK